MITKFFHVKNRLIILIWETFMLLLIFQTSWRIVFLLIILVNGRLNSIIDIFCSLKNRFILLIYLILIFWNWRNDFNLIEYYTWLNKYFLHHRGIILISINKSTVIFFLIKRWSSNFVQVHIYLAFIWVFLSHHKFIFFWISTFSML